MSKESAPNNVVVWGMQFEQERIPGLEGFEGPPPLGCQKLTSSVPGKPAKKLNQSLSVTPTKAFTLVISYSSC
jgi:hypothetical protein